MDVGRMRGSIRNNRRGKIEDYVVEENNKIWWGVKKLTAESKWPKPQIERFSKILKGIQGWIQVLLKQRVKGILEIPSFFLLRCMFSFSTNTYLVHKASAQFNNVDDCIKRLLRKQTSSFFFALNVFAMNVSFKFPCWFC